MIHVRRWAPLAVFVLVPSFLILPILFSGAMLYGHDVVSVFHYQRIVIAQAFREGRLPVWDPHVMAGFPLLAAVQGAVFYPPTWFCVFMSAGAFWTLSAWAHMVLSGLFAHRWLERGLGLSQWAALVGGFVFMMSGYIIGHVYAGHVNYLWAYPWIPAVLWRLEQFLAGPTLKRGVLLAAVLAMLFLAGVPQYVFFMGLLLLARGVHFVLADRDGRKDRSKIAGSAAAWLALGLLFCAPQLFPTLELVSQMQRGSAEDLQFASEHPMLPNELRLILFPLPRSQNLGEMDAFFWERCGFLGGGTILLLLAAFSAKHRQRYLWAGIALASLVLALGTYTPLYPGFVGILPGAGMFRGPGRYLLLFTVAATALAAVGFESLWSRARLPFRIPAAILSLAAAVQLTAFSKDLLVPISPRRLVWPPQVMGSLHDRLGLEGRLAIGSPRMDVLGACHVGGVDQVCGYDPMMLRRYAEVMNAARGAPIGKNIPVLASVGPHRVINMLSAWLWVIEGQYSSLNLAENPGALPRVWLVNNAVVVESAVERVHLLAQGAFDPRKTVILEEYPADAPPLPTEMPAGRAKVVSRGPGEYLIEAENDADAYLVLSEAYYPGWRAEIDGKPADVLPANHLIQAVRLPPGKHVVRFAYRSRFLGLGFAVAVLAGLVPVAIVLIRRRRR